MTTATADVPSADPADVFLQVGQVFSAGTPVVITTILGSCVGLCLWDPIRRSGGMAHYLVARWPGRGEASTRYGDVAIAQLVRSMGNLGSLPGDLRAKVFGGAHGLSKASAAVDIGTRNVAVAEEALAGLRIPIVSRDVGGNVGRKLLFRVDDGSAWVKRLSETTPT
jgi:chemotaxis protein CheD